MIDGYTPSPSVAKSSYIAGAKVILARGGYASNPKVLGGEFERFVAKVKADAWDEAYNATCAAHDVYGGLNYEPRNPYREANDE